MGAGPSKEEEEMSKKYNKISILKFKKKIQGKFKRRIQSNKGKTNKRRERYRSEGFPVPSFNEKSQKLQSEKNLHSSQYQ